VLAIFLEGLKRLSEPSRLNCCDFPSEWVGTKRSGHPMVDVRKCLWVADKVGGCAGVGVRVRVRAWAWVWEPHACAPGSVMGACCHAFWGDRRLYTADRGQITSLCSNA